MGASLAVKAPQSFAELLRVMKHSMGVWEQEEAEHREAEESQQSTKPGATSCNKLGKEVSMQEDIQQKILDSCLLTFIDNYEAPKGHHNWVRLRCPVEEYEALEEFIAYQTALGWMVRNLGEGLRLTDEGYLHHLPRATFLRAKSEIDSIAV
jgi:hypothetical protein